MVGAGRRGDNERLKSSTLQSNRRCASRLSLRRFPSKEIDFLRPDSIIWIQQRYPLQGRPP
eukprot:53792-Hanusia_phi.AAC.4